MSLFSSIFNRRSFPAFALPLLALVFIALVALSAFALRGLRVDLTEHRLYTLSAGTQRILDRIKEPVKLQLYYSEKASRSQPQFRVYAQRVRELLDEVVARSHGKVTLVVTDPESFSEAEEKAASLGLQGVPLAGTGDTLYFGLVGSNSTDGQTIMPFIQPDKEGFLEYDLAKLISTLAIDKKPVLALLSDLPTGPGMDQITQQPTMGWVVDRQLSELFEMRRLQPNPVSIGDDVDLLMVVHPKAISEDTQYAIDQFVMRGGHLLVFVDPLAESDPAGTMVDLAQAQPPMLSSDLPRLFKTWGLDYDPSKVVLDSTYALQVQPDPNAPPVRHLAILGLHDKAMNKQDVITAGLDSLNLSSVGALSLHAGSPLKMEALVQSSAATMLADTNAVRQASRNPGELTDAFKPDGQETRILAARLSGPLKSAFPERSGMAGHLATSKGEANIIVVADTDLLSDRLWVQVQNYMGQDIFNPFANNADFVYNAVDNMVGNADLIAVRTRASASRPFERVDVIRRAAEQRFQSKQKQLQQQLGDLEEKLSQLQPSTAGGAAPNLNREQQRQLLQYQEQKLKTRRDLRDVQHQLNADIESLGTRLKLINILGIPLLLMLLAGVIALRRVLNRRDAAN
ncbi:MAG TPA: Gldg family protein [Arenimonas sp.]|uniref:GldG family protein n=1 Tax=Arenimonas sp. TaxID=1872635 RepID=UPI002C0DF5D5|nr:Gldg family protein [Arenimonas sp.]HMB57392.1 Gldg family protein [Arenimonas sp.]